MSLNHIVLSSVPPLVICLAMMVIAAVLSIAGTLIFHSFVPHRSLKVHNDIAGPIFNTVGVIYAVLLAFIVVVTWQDFDKARLNTEMEVNALVNLYVDSVSFDQAFKDKAHKGIAEYTRAIIEEWDMLAKGGHNPKAQEEIEKLVVLYSGYLPKNEAEKIFFEKSIDKINRLFDLRIMRLTDARAGLHPLLWFVLIAGGVITIAFTIFFGTESLNAKILMSTLLALLIALVLFTIFEFSFPFSGSASVSCDSFKHLLARLGT